MNWHTYYDYDSYDTGNNIHPGPLPPNIILLPDGCYLDVKTGKKYWPDGTVFQGSGADNSSLL